MSRAHEKLHVFVLADSLVVDVYRLTRSLPQEERFGLQSQIRRAAVSSSTNLVEGCSRRTTRDYLQFVVLSLGSASEVRYLIGVARRLGFLDESAAAPLEVRYGDLVRGLQALADALKSRV